MSCCKVRMETSKQLYHHQRQMLGSKAPRSSGEEIKVSFQVLRHICWSAELQYQVIELPDMTEGEK